jgi:site-specific recombinase XerD
MDPSKLDQGWVNRIEALRGAYSENTIRAYRTDFRQFEEWCVERGVASLPASPELVADYVVTLSTERTPATIGRRIAGIARVHRLFGHPNPGSADVVVLALRRMHRTRGRRQAQAAGLSADLKAKLLAAADSDLRGLRNKAMIAVGYDTLCRRSELVALRAEDVAPLDGGSSSILIRRSKTDQAGDGRLGYLSAEAFERLQRWTDAAGIVSGPLFRRVQGRVIGAAQLHPFAVNRILKRLAEQAGIDPELVRRLSGHSMRVGAAVDMVENGIDLVPVMLAGGWKSPNMVVRYTQQISLAKSGMARLHAKWQIRG